MIQALCTLDGAPADLDPRFDITGAALHDSLPKFSLPAGLPRDSILSGEVLPGLATALATPLLQNCPCLSQARRALEQTALIACFINKNAQLPHFWKPDINATRLLGPAAHHILSIPRFRVDIAQRFFTDDEVFCEVIRLALLILMSGLKNAFSLTTGEMGAFQQKFQNILPLVPGVVEFCPELSLWSLIIVACSYTRPRPLSLITAIHQSMVRMGIQTATEAITIAQSIIWVESLMGYEAETLIVDIAHHSPDSPVWESVTSLMHSAMLH
jgi:hypothetical protein